MPAISVRIRVRERPVSGRISDECRTTRTRSKVRNETSRRRASIARDELGDGKPGLVARELRACFA
jgi:hypothetical protein